MPEKSGLPSARARRRRGQVGLPVSLPRNAGSRILQPLGGDGSRCERRAERDEDDGRLTQQSKHVASGQGRIILSILAGAAVQTHPLDRP